MLIDRRGKTSQQNTSNNNKNNSNTFEIKSPIPPKTTQNNNTTPTGSNTKRKNYRWNNTNRPISLRTEVNDLLSCIQRIIGHSQRRLSFLLPTNNNNNNNKSKGRRYRSSSSLTLSSFLLALLLLLTVSSFVWYSTASVRDRYQRLEVCRQHRRRPSAVQQQQQQHPNQRSAVQLTTTFYEHVEDQFEYSPRVVYYRGGEGEDTDGGDKDNVDYGDLKFRMWGSYQDRFDKPVILDGPEEYSWHMFTDVDTHPNLESYYAFDDDEVRNEDYLPKKCRRVSWHKLYNPSCNQIHEIEVMNESNKFLGSGFYRDVFQVQPISNNDPAFVYKLNRYRHKFATDRYEFIRMDALIMERLTASPRIPDIHGHCGTTMLTEFLNQEIEEVMTPGSAKCYNDTKCHDRWLPAEGDVKPKNNYSARHKVEMALAMAEALADLHGFKDGVMVHDDVMPSQFLYAANGKIKLNDFNRGEAMLFDEQEGAYCRYTNGKGGGDFRSPEEFRDGLLNEKIDVYSMGNMMYGLLTGLGVFYDVEKDKVIQKRILKGETPYIDPRYRTRSFAEGRLVDIMERCWAFKQNDRADIFEVVRHLRDTLQQISNQE